LPANFGEAHGKEPFAEPDVAERPLPCSTARQRLCRADFDLCRVIWLHGSVQSSRSVGAFSTTLVAMLQKTPASYHFIFASPSTLQIP
jgi:hypothetical protein